MDAAPIGRKLFSAGFALRTAILYILAAGASICAADALFEISSFRSSDGWLLVAATAFLLFAVVVLALQSLPPDRSSPSLAGLGAAGSGILEGERSYRRQQAAAPLLIFTALALAIGLTGWMTYVDQRATLRGEKHADIAAIADLKAAEIGRWVSDRKGHANLITHDPFLAIALERWLADGGRPDAQREELLRWLSSLQQTLGYKSLAIVAASGAVLLSTAPVLLDQAGQERLAAALLDGNVVLTDLYRADAAESGAFIALDVIAPLRPADPAAEAATAALLLRVDAAHYLFPLVQDWPTPSPTAETSLVRREGPDVLFLNALRHIPDPPMSVRRPVEDPDLPAARAIRGEIGVQEGLDYRGVPVLAASRPIPGTDWIMVAEIDIDEVYDPLRRIAIATATVVAVCLFAAASGIGFWWMRQRARMLAAELHARLERQALVRHFDYLSKYANDIILLSDERGAIVEANARAEQAYGLSRDELMARDLRSLQDPATQGTADRHAALHQQAAGRVFEALHRRQDGTTFPVEVSTRMIDVQGKQFRHSIVRDISDRVQVEKRARDLDEQLRRVGIANELGQMVSSLAHELRQPLTAAMNYINACRRFLEAAPAPPQKALTMTTKACEQIGRADRIVHDLRAFLQNQSSEFAAEDIVRTVDETMEVALMGMAHLGLQVDCRHEVNLPLVRADKIRIQQVLLNLIRNAVEAMADSPRRHLIVETRLASAGEVQVSVADTGCGIPPQIAARLFEPFVTSKPGGMGIGLPVCRGIIEAHGGRLWAEPAEGGGAIFRFSLPVADPAEQKPDA